MKLNYIVKVLPAADCNPEFKPDKRLSDGYEAAGYLIVCFDKDGNPTMETLNNVSTYSIAQFMAGMRADVSGILMEAAAIADGLLKAKEIHERRKEK